MGKRNYTHVQALLPEIKAMPAEGKTQREVAEYYGSQNKRWGKGCLSGSGEKNASWKPGSFHVQKDGQGKMLLPETLQQSRPVRSSDCAWRTNCCGIFCGPQEGGEGKGKIPHHIIVTAACIRCPSCARFLQYQKRLLRLCPSPGQAGEEAALAERIAQQQECSFRTYGYRRMWLWLKSQNIFRNPKTVLRIMKKYDLLSEIRRRRKWTQMGQRLHKYENLLSRDVHADSPNRRWVTDISYIHTKQGVLYRSMIRDLCDNGIAACKTGGGRL